jgi:hypothetical protein
VGAITEVGSDVPGAPPLLFHFSWDHASEKVVCGLMCRELDPELASPAGIEL